MMSEDFSIDLIGDEDLKKILTNLDYKTQQQYLKRILRDTAQQTFVKKLKQASPPSSRLKKSMGHVTGKSKKVATVFAGPRMAPRFGKLTSTNQGWLANIIEHNKFKPRYPGRDDRFSGRKKKRPVTPMGVRMHSGVFPWGPFIERTILNTIRFAEDYEIKAIRKLFLKEWNKYKRSA